MDNEKQVVNVLESFLHDVMEGESDVSEISNMLGHNELKVLLKLAKKGLSDPIPLPTIKPGEIDEHPLDLLYKTKYMTEYQFEDWMKERTSEEIDSLTDIYRALKRAIANEKVNRVVSHE